MEEIERMRLLYSTSKQYEQEVVNIRLQYSTTTKYFEEVKGDLAHTQSLLAQREGEIKDLENDLEVA